jgi:hypothetical protein
VTTPREGASVSYIGHPDRGLTVGDRGRVLSTSGQASHVMWLTGARTQAVDLVDHEDLVCGQTRTATAVESPFEDSLEVPSLSMIAVRDTYDASGETGVLNALNEAGHLAGLSQVAEEALEVVIARVKNDQAMTTVLGQLDPDEADGLARLTAAVLLRDAFGGEGA